MTSTTAAQIKRHIGDTLAVAEVGGEMWASNRIWLARAEHVAPFTSKYGIEGEGVWDILGGEPCKREDAKMPGLRTLLGKFLHLADYTVQLQDATLGDWGDIYTNGGDGRYYKLLTTSTRRKTLAVRADWLDWLEDAPAPCDPTAVYEMRLATTRRKAAIIAIIASPVAPEPGDGTSPQIAAVVMPIRRHRPTPIPKDEEEALVAGAEEAIAYFRSRES
jgi:hypothetical protein